MDRISPELFVLYLSAGSLFSYLIKLVNEIGLADVLKGNRLTKKELSRKLRFKEDRLARLLNLLFTLGIVSKEGNKYGDNEILKLLARKSENTLDYFSKLYSSDLYSKVWRKSKDSMISGKPVAEILFKGDRWKSMEDNWEILETFHRAMSQWSSVIHYNAIKDFDFSKFTKVVDVGGGRGRLLSKLLRDNPHLEGVLFDLSIAANVDLPFVSGNFFKDKIPEGDLVILAHVLIDWDDKRAMKILKNCRKSMKKGSVLVVLDHVLDNPSLEQKGFSNLLDFHIMLMGDGKVRSKKEFAELLQKSGFKVQRIFSGDCCIHRIEAIVV